MYGRDHSFTLGLWAVLLLPALLLGCSEDTTKPERPPPEDPRSTKVALIAYFAEAHDEKDIEAYEECLHPEYAFYFSEDDLADPCWDWADSIDREEDLTVTANMFAAEFVTDILVDFRNLTVVGDTVGFSVEEIAVGQDTFTVYSAEFDVDMHVVVESGEETIDHWVDDRAKIYLRPDPADATLWTVWKIEDRGNEHLKSDWSAKDTWSRLKAIFRP